MRYIYKNEGQKYSKCFINYFPLSQTMENCNNNRSCSFYNRFFGAITVGNIVINDTVNNRLTPQGYPETEFLGISAFSYQYGLVLTGILGLFVLAGRIFMDSKKLRK